MKYLIFILSLSGCGAISNLQSNLDKMSSNMDNVTKTMSNIDADLNKTNKSIDDMNTALKSTVTGIHTQTLAGAITEMFSDSATKYVSPNSSTPTGMIGPALMFSQEATSDEIVGQMFLWDLDYKQSQPDPVNQTTMKIADKDKFVKLTAMEVISGMMSQEKLESVMSTEGNSQYGSILNALLLLRYEFVTSYLLDIGVFSNVITTVAAYQSALDYINEVKYLETNIGTKSYVISGFFDTDKLGLNQTLTLPKNTVSKDYYKKLKTKFDKELDPSQKTDPNYEKVKNEIDTNSN